MISELSYTRIKTSSIIITIKFNIISLILLLITQLKGEKKFIIKNFYYFYYYFFLWRNNKNLYSEYLYIQLIQ